MPETYIMIVKQATQAILPFLILSVSFNASAGNVLCTPDASTAFNDSVNTAFRITNNAVGVNRLFSQCTDLSNEVELGTLDGCIPALTQPINGLGMNPTDKLLYGFSPTDALGIGTHLNVTLPFPSPGQPGDIMVADDVTVYKIGNDGGFQNIGLIQPPNETAGLPVGTHQVNPIVHNASSFNELGDLFVLAYRTNYSSSANIPAGTAQVLYQTPQIVIGKINNNDLINANGGTIAVNWVNIDSNSDAICAAVLNKFRDDSNVFSTCVVDQYLISADENSAVQSCLVSTPLLDKGLHDFAVSPVNGHYYAYDSMTYDDKDVLVDVDPATNSAVCTVIDDMDNATNVLSSLMFSSENNLVAIFSNQSTGSWIDVSNGSLTPLPAVITATPFGDGSSLPFGSSRFYTRGQGSDVLFKNGFEAALDFIFTSGFESLIQGTASMELMKSGEFNDANNDGFAQVGETIDYSFSVTNTGELTLNNVFITDVLVDVPGLIGELIIATTDDSTFVGSYAITQADIDAGFVSNSAVARATDSLNDTIVQQSNDGVALITALPASASLNLTNTGEWFDANMDGLAQAGETINYAFTVTNTGQLTLSNVSISDAIINVAAVIPQLNVGETDAVTLSGTYVLTQDDVDAGSVSNVATANAVDLSNNAVSAQSNDGIPVVVSLPGSASMNLQKIGSFIDANNDGFAQAGESINYSFTITNTGNLTLSNLSISDPIVTVSGMLNTLTVSSSDNLTFTAVYILTQADVNTGFVSNLATANAMDPSNGAVTTQSNNGMDLITNFTSTASISLAKFGEFNDLNMDGLAQVNETIDYSFTVKNTGSLTLTDVAITDPLLSIPGIIPLLMINETDDLTLSGVYAITQADIDNGKVENLATVKADDPSMNSINAQSNGGLFLNTNLSTLAAITLDKVAAFEDSNNDGFAQVGELINYSFTVTNTGTQTLINVTLNDALVSVPGMIAVLSPSAADSMTFSGVYVLTQNDIDTGTVTNLATINAEDPFGTGVNAQSNGGMPLITVLPIFTCPVF